MMIKRITDQGVTIEVSHEDLRRMENVAKAYSKLPGKVDEATLLFSEDLFIECASVRREMDRSDHLTPVEVKRGFEEVKKNTWKVVRKV